MNEKKLVGTEVIAAIAASLATIALIYSGWLQTYAGYRLNQIMFLLTYPAIAISLTLGGGVHDASEGVYILALFVEFLLIWWLFIHAMRKIIVSRKRSLN